ncbi:hypothetical protein VNO78_32865 [Psophocarpus tetragonolobus]|uniref:Uncharacterized protein n=1 Tax=Psophocarpus tetragonolobus TaxID=3891 RepID=A0AAN9RQB5_PSOTE
MSLTLQFPHHLSQQEPSVRLTVRVSILLSPNRKQLTLSYKDNTVISLVGPTFGGNRGLSVRTSDHSRRRHPHPTRSSSATSLHALPPPHVTPTLPKQHVIAIATVTNINGLCFTTHQSSL